MNEQLQQALADIIMKASEAASAGADFLLSELPEVLRQLLVFKVVYSAVEMIILLILISGYAYFWKFYSRTESKLWKEGDAASVGTMVFGVFGGIATVIFVVAVFCDLETIIKIWLAPKIYLIEYAAQLAK